MPVIDEGEPDHEYADTNGSLRREINDDIAGQIDDLADVKRTADSIFTSDTFHLDSRSIGGNRWKVEIQYKSVRGKVKRQTVAVVLVENNATSVADFRTAVRRALTERHVFRVT